MFPPKEKYINPFTDFGFKKLFGTEMNKDLLMDFLNELIPNHGKIIEITYLHPEQLGRSEADRNAVYDIHCKTDSDDYFIVEMQRAYQEFFKDRSIFYASFPIRDQGMKGDWDFGSVNKCGQILQRDKFYRQEFIMTNIYSDDFKREIVFLRQNGKSVKDLTTIYKLGKNTVKEWVKSS